VCVNWCRNFTAIFCDFCKCLPWFLPFYRDFLLSLRRRYIFYPCLFVCSSVFLSVKDYSKPRAWIWMKCCVSTDVETWTNWLTFEPDSDHSPDVGTGLLSPISYKRCYAELRNFTSGKSHWRRAARASRGFKMVLFTEPSEDLCRR